MNAGVTSLRPLVLTAVVALGVSARGTAALAASQLDSAIAQAGKQDYVHYCAACHGREGRGDGPVASALATKPPDLTLISERRKGEFPMKELAEMIDGRTLPPAHGRREMPVWGERLVEPFEDQRTQELGLGGRLLMLLIYLQSIQR